MTGTGRVATGVRRRLTHDETRALLLDWGTRVLFREGLAYGMEAVSLEDAVRETGVSRTSAYRIWSSDLERSPQEAFRRDVLLHSIRWPATEDLDELIRLRESFIESIRSVGVDARTPESAAEAVGEVLMEQILDHQAVALFRALQATFASRAEEHGDHELSEVLDTTESRWREAMIEFVLAPLVGALALTPKFDVSIRTALEQTSVAISAFLTGVVPKASLPTAGAIIDKPLADGSNLKLSSVCLSALVMAFFESPEA